MRPKSMILIVIALGCGLIASIGISQVMENNVTEAPVEAPTETIFVAVADIPLGQLLAKEMVKSEEWPQDKVPEGAIRSMEEIESRRTLTRLYPGEPLLQAKLIDADKFAGASEKIPKGFRVASVKVTMDSSASGLINPGDRVDVLVFLARGRGITLTGTRTILKNVTVFAVNDRFQRDPDDEGSTSNAKTVSLLVKPSQVERIMLAQELGKIKLSLRRSDDDEDDSATGATLADLDDEGSGGDAPNFSIAAAAGEPKSSGITDFLNGMKGSDGPGVDIKEAAWVMHIHTPSNVQVYNWDDPDQLPRELLSAAAPSSLPTTDTAPVTATESSAAESEAGESTETQWIDGDSAAALLN